MYKFTISPYKCIPFSLSDGIIVFIKNGTSLYNLVIIIILQLMTTTFFDEFFNFLIDINISNFIILGDFNCHCCSSLFPHTEFTSFIYTL